MTHNVHSLLATAVRSFRITCRSIFRFCSRSLNEFRLLLTAWISRHASDDIACRRTPSFLEHEALLPRRRRRKKNEADAKNPATRRHRVAPATNGRFSTPTTAQTPYGNATLGPLATALHRRRAHHARAPTSVPPDEPGYRYRRPAETRENRAETRENSGDTAAQRRTHVEFRITVLGRVITKPEK